MGIKSINKKLTTGLLIPGIGLMCPAFVSATTTENSDDVMVVTASAIEQRIKKAPASISVITAEELQQNIVKSSNDLADILSRVSGVSKAIGTDVSSGIQIRGMPAAYTLILVDGKRMGSSNNIKTTQQNYFDDINWLPVESIERIEIVRGPMSALYGSDAMGGVVNIITKKNSATDWHGSLAVGTRQPKHSHHGDTHTWTGTLAGPLGQGVDLRMSGSWNKRNADTSDTHSLRFGSGLEGRKVYNYGAELGWDINSNHRVTVSTRQGTEAGIQGASSDGTLIDLRGVNKLERTNYSVDYRGLFDFGSARLAAYENKYKNAASDVPVIRNGKAVGKQDSKLWTRERIIEGDISLPFDLILPQNLTIGGQWKEDELDNPRSIGVVAASKQSYGKSNSETSSKGIFVEDQIGLMDDLTLTLGLRRDHTDYGNKTTPRAYLVWNATDSLTFKGGYSEGFKAPSIRQASLGFIETSRGAACNGYAEYKGGRCYTMGNNSLKPETSKNWEVGTLFEHAGWNAGLTFFDNRFQDKIATAPQGYIYGQKSGFWLERVNLDDAHTQGFEGHLTLPLVSEPLSPWLQKLSLSNNFTRMIKAEDSRGVMLVTTPKFTTWSSLDWQVNNDLSFAFTAQHYSKMLGLNNKADQEARGATATARIRNAYTLYGLAGHYKATKNLKVNVGIDNLFDTNPAPSKPSGSATSGNNYYVPGQTFYASMTASF